MKFSVERKVLAGLTTVIVIMAGIGLVSYFSINQLVGNSRQALDSLDVRRKTHTMLVSMLNLETGTRGYIITGDDRYLKPYQTAVNVIEKQMAEVSSAVAKAPAQRDRIARLIKLVTEELEIERYHVELRRSRNFEASMQEFRLGEGRREMDRIRELIAEIVAQQDELMARLNVRGAQQGRQATWIIGIGGVFGFLFVAALSVAIHKDLARRIEAETEIIALNKKLSSHNQELESTNKELEAFSYSVSHDLRAPLRALDGFSLAVMEDCAAILPPADQNFLHRIRAASQRMGYLIDDLLNLSRLTRVEMTHETVDLSQMARDTVAELQATQPQRVVESVIAEGMVAEADPRLLQVAMTNLLGNAWKFTAKRADARIEFGSSGDNGSTAFFVRDNGVGFDMAYTGKLFGAFQRLHAMHEFPGTGIGLATVRRIVERHGGKAWAQGVLNHGATFFFSIPKQDGATNGK